MPKRGQPLKPHFQNNNYSVRDEARETEEQGGEGRRKEKAARSVFLFKLAECLERVEPAAIWGKEKGEQRRRDQNRTDFASSSRI